MKVFLDNWCVFDGNKTTIIDGDLKSTDHYAVTKDYIRSTVFIAVRSLEHEFKAKRKLTYTHHPSAVYAACAVDRTELKLAPLTSLQNISVGDDAKGPIKVSCKGWDKGIFLTGPPKATWSIDRTKNNQNKNDQDKFMFVPFWWVDATSDEALVNMKYVSKKVDDCTVVYLTNSKKLEKNERLFVYKPVVKKTVHLEGGTKVDDDESSEGDESSESEEPKLKKGSDKEVKPQPETSEPQTKKRSTAAKSKQQPKKSKKV